MSPDYYNIDPEIKLLNDNWRYRKSVRDLLFISTITRSDISACVNILRRRNEKLRNANWVAIDEVIHY